MDNVKQDRIKFLDGLRGVAILLVVMYHAYAHDYSQLTQLMPQGNKYADFPLFAYGWLGVHLFFIISGFVILMTLEKCGSFLDFILRRWLRLFPAMLVCSVIIFATAPLLPERPGGELFYSDLLPGLTFIEPAFWGKLLGLDLKSVDGAFWSLYVEVKFYILFGVLYYITGWRNAILALITLHFLSVIGLYVIRDLPVTAMYMTYFNKIMFYGSARYYGWFAAGALYYKYFCDRKNHVLISAIAIACVASLVEGGGDWQPKIFAILLVFLFTLSLINSNVRTVLTHPVLLFIGLISYPLYLIHQNIMVALSVKIGQLVPTAYAIGNPILPIALVIGMGWGVTIYMEPWMREKILPHYRRFCAFVGVKRMVSSSKPLK